MNEFSSHRIAKLMRLEFLLHRKYYLMLMIGAFLLVTFALFYV